MGQILSCIGLGFVPCHGAAVGGEYGTESAFDRFFQLFIHGIADDGTDRHSGSLGTAADTKDDLAAQTLAVDAAFACKDHIAAFQQIVKANGVQYAVDARYQLGTQHGAHACTHAAGRTGTRHGLYAGTKGFQQATQYSQTLIEEFDHFRIGTFLRAKHIGSTALTPQRIVDITHDADAYPFQLLLYRRKVDGCNTNKIAAAGQELVAVAVHKACAQRRCRTAAAVIGTAAAQTQQDMDSAVLQCMIDEHTYTIRGGIHGIFAALDHGQTGSGRHLNNSRFAIRQTAIETLNVIHTWAFDGDMDLFAACCRQHGIDRAFTTIGHRNTDDLTIGEVAQSSFPCNITYIQRRYGALKGIGRQNNFLHH